MAPRYSRIELAKRRARVAKAGLGALIALVFGVAFVGAKQHQTSSKATTKTKRLRRTVACT